MHPENGVQIVFDIKKRRTLKKEYLAIGVRGRVRVDKDVFEISQ